MGWTGFVRVDGLTYQWMGMTGNMTNLTSTVITPTRSIFTVQAGAMLLNVTFLSPIEVRVVFFCLNFVDRDSLPLESLLTGFVSHFHFLMCTSMRRLWTANRTRYRFTPTSVQVIQISR
jgi:hypothetical protein